MTIELRCDNGIRFGDLDAEVHVIEVKCKSRRCGAGPGVVVLHEFDTESGKLIGTRKFREPLIGRS